MYQLYTAKKRGTNWFHLVAIIALTLISFYYIRNAFAKPYAELKLYNEVRIAEIYGEEGVAENEIE